MSSFTTNMDIASKIHSAIYTSAGTARNTQLAITEYGHFYIRRLNQANPTVLLQTDDDWIARIDQFGIKIRVRPRYFNIDSRNIINIFLKVCGSDYQIEGLRPRISLKSGTGVTEYRYGRILPLPHDMQDNHMWVPEHERPAYSVDPLHGMNNMERHLFVRDRLSGSDGESYPGGERADGLIYSMPSTPNPPEHAIYWNVAAPQPASPVVMSQPVTFEMIEDSFQRIGREGGLRIPHDAEAFMRSRLDRLEQPEREAAERRAERMSRNR